MENKYQDRPSKDLYRAIRFSFLNAKYREQVNFSFDKLETCFNTVKKVDETSKRLARFIESAESEIDVTV